MKSRIVTAFLVMLSTIVLTDSAMATVVSSNVSVVSVQSSNVIGSEVWVTFNPAPFYPPCSEPNEYLLGGGLTNINRMMSLATEALLNSRLVTAYWSGTCSNGGNSGYPILLGIILK